MIGSNEGNNGDENIFVSFFLFYASSSLLLTVFCLLYVKPSEHSVLATHNMYFLLTCLILPIINAIVIVQIHRSSIYRPRSACAFLSNVSWSTDASIQSCIWECTYENSCQTAIYFSEENVCSMFAEVCQSDGIQSSESVEASVICCRKNQGAFVFFCNIE